jgi:hypothetical protein
METALPAGKITTPRVSIAGIGKVTQPIPSFGGRESEEEDQFKIRCSSRLKHKKRATSALDYEDLILERFPQIHRVKCFPNMIDEREHWERPGSILITVVPTQQDGIQLNMKPMVNARLLNRIKDYVAGLSSPFVSIKVRNPTYERIQVRVKVQFHRDDRGGVHRKRLNRAVVEYLSPWSRTGYTTCFGWCVRRDDLESFIRSLDYVHFVTDFSMLRVTEDDRGRYNLSDTAALGSEHIYPECPWSIAIPFEEHYIEIIQKPKVVQPEITGIDELEIGSNFIVPGK